VDRITVDVSEMKMETKHQMDTIRDHVTADQKIINHIQPLMPILQDLAEMVEDYKYEKQRKVKTSENIKAWTLRVGAVTATIGLVAGINKYWKSILSLFF
jgi:hypothetical protein